MHHVTFATWSRTPLGEPRGLVRSMLRAHGDGVVLFCVVHDHAHFVVDGVIGRWVGYAGRSLRREARLGPPRVAEVEGRTTSSGWSGTCFGSPRSMA